MQSTRSRRPYLRASAWHDYSSLLTLPRDVKLSESISASDRHSRPLDAGCQGYQLAVDSDTKSTYADAAAIGGVSYAATTAKTRISQIQAWDWTVFDQQQQATDTARSKLRVSTPLDLRIIAYLFYPTSLLDKLTTVAASPKGVFLCNSSPKYKP